MKLDNCPPSPTPEHNLPPSTSPAVDRMGDHCKLVSLLALAGGAVAMPQTGSADIVYTNLSSPVTVGYGYSPFVIANLPGTAQLAFDRTQHGAYSVTATYFVSGFQNAGYVRLKTNGNFAVPVATEGRLWSEIAGNAGSLGVAGAASYSSYFPSSFSDRYYAFTFKDSTQSDLLCYGWVNVSLNNGSLFYSRYPYLTIYSWAYDISGNQLPMGAVPEPSSAAILALGALTLGAKGLRHWRSHRAPARAS